MNFIQKTLGIIFPPYKFSILRKEQTKLISKIVLALPNEFSEIKIQTISGRVYGLSDWKWFPDFKFVSMAYAGDSIFKYKRRGQNFKITGLQIFSIRNNKFEKVEILIQDNLFRALKINNSAYQLNEFDLHKFKTNDILKTEFLFPQSEIDIFYDGLDPAIKQKLDPNELFEIDFNNRIYYSFNDLEDGNYLAVDKKLNVYSLIHDAKPMVKKMNISFMELLNELKSNKFDKEKHFDDRYKNGQ